MNETKVPSSDAVAINAGFNEHCNWGCEGCIYNHCNHMNLCIIQYTQDILTGKMKLSDSFHKEKPKPEPEIPAWCKVGAWVTDAYPDENEVCCVLKITEILGEMVIAEGMRKGTTFKRPSNGFKPVRFREPTIDEAKTFLGKVMEYNWEGRDPVATIITIVSLDSSDIRYNGLSFEEMQDWNATINGIPIGVPEVDEELLKGGRKNEEN